MKPWLARMHRTVGLVVGVQLVLWLASGLLMSLMDPAAVNAERYRAGGPPVAVPWPVNAMDPGEAAVAAARPVDSLSRTTLLGRAVYRFEYAGSAWLADAITGARLRISAADATRLAAVDYNGPGRMASPRYRSSAPREARDHKGPMWEVRFADDAGTTLYISADDGRVLERRTDAWRLFDIAWMLHIMDYRTRSDFNHPLLVGSAIAGTWMALSGLWLLGATFARGQWRPAATRPRTVIQVLDSVEGTTLTVPARLGETVFDAFSRAGRPLPSQCGGGQACSLCVVRVLGEAPAATAGDRAQLGAAQLAAGERLGCSLMVVPDMSVEVAHASQLVQSREATVEQVIAISPHLREIRLRPQNALDGCQAGDYVLLDIPAYRLGRDSLAWNDAPLPTSLQQLPAHLINAAPVRRAYSPSLTPRLADGCLPLLVRLDTSSMPLHVGIGSGYLFSLRQGDRIRFTGPFGKFRLSPGGREKIFVGGGAGMAPLRAMLRERLEAGGSERLHFWYGARGPAEVPYRSELEELAALHARFAFHVVYSEADNGVSGPRWIHEALRDGLLATHPALDECEFYLCGPTAMLQATLALLMEIGVSPERIALDDFKT